MLNNNFNKYNNNIKLIIESIEITNHFIENIPINNIIQSHDIIIIEKNDNFDIDLDPKKIDNLFTIENIESDYILIKISNVFNILENSLNNNSTNYYTINNITNIKINNLSGIPLNFINSDFPTNNNQLNGYKTIIDIDDDNISIDCGIKAFRTINNLGGENILICKIEKTIEENISNSEYRVELDNPIYNIKHIELISSEFHNINIGVVNEYNNYIHWKIMDEKNELFFTKIETGNYSFETLSQVIVEKMNKYIYDSNNINIFSLNISKETNIVTFELFRNILINNGITIKKINLNNTNRFILLLNLSGNNLEVGFYVKISNIVIDYLSYSISDYEKNLINNIINNNFFVWKIEEANNLFSLLLPENELITENLVNNIKINKDFNIKINKYFKLFLDKNNSIGNVLGFRNVGDSNSVTNFSTKIIIILLN